MVTANRVRKHNDMIDLRSIIRVLSYLTRGPKRASTIAFARTGVPAG